MEYKAAVTTTKPALHTGTEASWDLITEKQNCIFSTIPPMFNTN